MHTHLGTQEKHTELTFNINCHNRDPVTSGKTEMLKMWATENHQDLRVKAQKAGLFTDFHVRFKII